MGYRTYDYKTEIEDAIIDYLNDVIIPITNNMKISVKEYIHAKYDEILEDMALSDSVTGNGSESYTCNTFIAKEYVLDNLDIVTEMYENGYISNSHIVDTVLYGQWESMDVVIRCYLLPLIFSDIVVKM